MPVRHSEHVSSSFARVISSNEESNVLSIPLTSEHKSPSISHFFLLKLKVFYLVLNLRAYLHIQNPLYHFNFRLDQSSPT